MKTIPSNADVDLDGPDGGSAGDVGVGTTKGPNRNMRHIITTDISTNWAHTFGETTTADGATPALVTGQYLVYKFMPSKASTYNYVGECSNRGTCNRDSGVCECFPGYSSDNCHTQSSLAL